MAQAVSRRPLIAEARVRSRASSCTICGEQNGTMTVFSQGNSVFPYQYHSTNAPVLVFISMLHLPEGQTVEVWEPAKQQCAFGNPVSQKVLSLSLQTLLSCKAAVQHSSRRASREIPCLSCNTIHCRTHNSPAVDSIFTHKNPCLKLILFSHLRLVLSSRIFTSHYATKSLYVSLLFLHHVPLLPLILICSL
jgi:hypothetical protein